VEVVEDAGFSAKDLKRPGIQEALRVLEEGDAKALVAAKLDLAGLRHEHELPLRCGARQQLVRVARL
jgi:DNA invertase Pin-like site-specific DNA recombinase